VKKYKYFTKDEDNNSVEIDEVIADDVIRQYIERRYTGAIIIAVFIIGFLCGVIASA
jgi:phosphatidylglycerophosphatase A